MTAIVQATSATEPPRRDWVEVVATVLLALAAVATAWSSYQANRWNGETTKASGGSTPCASRAPAPKDWLKAKPKSTSPCSFSGSTPPQPTTPRLADFYRDRFRAEFRPAFEAWQATDPLTNADAPPTPFAMQADYQLQAAADVEEFDAQAEALAATVRLNVQRSANYVLGVVLFAVALFFAGMSTS